MEADRQAQSVAPPSNPPGPEKFFVDGNPRSERLVPQINEVDQIMRRIRRELAIAKSGLPDTIALSGAATKSSWHWNAFAPFAKGAPSLSLLTSGWSYPEDDRVWSDGRLAIMSLPQPVDFEDILIEFEVTPYCAPQLGAQRVRVSNGNRLIAASTIKQPGKFSLLMPKEQTKADGIELKWEFPDAISPMELGISLDPRRLGIALHSLSACLRPWIS
jgi:hypothetical protein